MEAEKAVLRAAPETLEELAQQIEFLSQRREGDDPHIGDEDLPPKWAADIRQLSRVIS